MKRADDVRLNEIVRPGNGTIHMRFRGEVHDVRDAVSRNDFSDLILVLQVAALEDVLGVVLDIAQILQMARVRQTVEVDQPTHFRRIDDLPDQIGPDKPGATCHQ